MSRSEFVRANVRAIPALMIPVVVLGGIYGGFVTVTEAAALSAVVALFISIFIYRECEMKEVFGLIAEGVKRTAAIIFIVATALAFGHWLDRKSTRLNYSH